MQEYYRYQGQQTRYLSLFISHEFEGVAGLGVGLHFGAVGDFPEGRVYCGKEGVGIFDDRMDMCHDEAVGRGEGLGVDLAAADDEAAGFRGIRGPQSGRSGRISRFKGRNGHNPFRSVKTAGNDDIRAFREWTADGFEGLSSHDHGTARSRALEELQVFGNMP